MQTLSSRLNGVKSMGWKRFQVGRFVYRLQKMAREGCDHFYGVRDVARPLQCLNFLSSSARVSHLVEKDFQRPLTT